MMEVREEYKIRLNNYIFKLNKRKDVLKEESLRELNSYNGDADGFFGMMKRLYNEYDCIRVCVKENESLRDKNF